jgi:hypothetical protein
MTWEGVPLFFLMTQKLVNGAASLNIRPGALHMAERIPVSSSKISGLADPLQTLACACRVLNCILIDSPPDPDDVALLRRSVSEARPQFRLEDLARLVILDSLGNRKPPRRARRPTGSAGSTPRCCGARSMQEKRLIEIEAVIANFERRGLPHGSPNLLDSALDKRARIRRWIEAHDCGRRVLMVESA